MSVRRLAPKELQPANFAFTAENLVWAKEQIAKYPPGRQASAAIAILWRMRVERERGGERAAHQTAAVGPRVGSTKNLETSAPHSTLSTTSEVEKAALPRLRTP